jgi:pimeloyl-ACP methyl ester carboxylesterase
MKAILLLLALGCGSAPAMLEIAPAEKLTVCSEGPGDGESVVLIPGLSGCSYGFRKLTPLLHEQGLRTIIIEPLAVGESARPSDVDYTMTAQAVRLGAVLDSLEIENAIFVAQGIGGAMVFRLAVERPELLTGFVSVEGGSAEAAISPNIKNTLKLAKILAKMGGKNLMRDRYAENLKENSGDPSWIDRRTVGRYFRGTGRDISAAMDVMVAMTEQTEPWAMTPRLPEIRIPVIVLLGTAPHEAELTSEDIEELRRGLRNVEFREIPGAGHFIYEEQPRAVADAVAELVAKLTAGGYQSAGAALVPGDDGGTDLVQPRESR